MARRHSFLHLPLILLPAAAGAVWLYGQRTEGAPVGPFLGMYLACALVVGALVAPLAAWVGRRAPGGHGAALACTALVMLGVVPAFAQRSREAMDAANEKVWSDLMWEPAPELGEGAMQMRAGVRDAVAVVPDRPLAQEELDGVRLDERITRRRTFRVNTNSRRLRGVAEVDEPKTRFRIVCLGGSVTFGHGVADDEAWCARLGPLLGVEALNAGMPGRPPVQVARWASLHLAELQPDLVLFSEVPFRGSDPDPLRTYAAAVREVARIVPPGALAVVLSPSGPMTARVGPAGETLDLGTQVWNLLMEFPVLDPTAVLDRAAFQRGGLAYEERGSARRLFIRASGEVVLEAEGPESIALIYAAFEQDPSLRFDFFIDNAHIDAEAHALVAQTVADWLVQRGLVPH